MTDIKCPICRDRISGGSPDNLSERLREHLADIHQITRLAGESRSRTSSSELERDVTAWSRRDPSLLTPEEVRQREEITSFNRPPLGYGATTERKVETWSGREPTGETPESERLIQETGQWQYPRMETKEEREVRTWRSDNRSGPSESGSMVRQEAAGRTYPREGRSMGEGASMSDVPHGGTVHRMFNRHEMTMAMDCPLCGKPVYGSDDDDLSDEMRFHFKDYHQIRRR